jgi:hypothetical protein
MDTATINTLAKASETVTAEPVTFNITLVPQSRLHGWLMRKKILPCRRSMEIKPVVLGNLLRISKLLLTIDTDKMQKGNLLDVSYHLAGQHADTIAEILAIAIQGNKNKPGARLISLIKQNLTAKEILYLLTLVLQQLDLTNFISSIISIRGLNVLDRGEKTKPENEVSPSTQGS